MRIICPCCNEELTEHDKLGHIHSILSAVRNDLPALKHALEGRMAPESITALEQCIEQTLMLSDISPDPVGGIN